MLSNLIRVLVADPHPVVREGLKRLLNAQPDVRVAGETGDCPEALAAETDAAVIVAETCLLGVDPAGLVKRLRGKVIVLTDCDGIGTLRRMLSAGVVGYVLKRGTTEQLVRAVRAVAAGGSYIDPELAAGVVGNYLAPQEDGVELSEREQQVLTMIARGYSNKEVAARLRLSVKTVETYKSRTMDKLKTHSRVELVRYAVKQGWVIADGPVAVRQS